MEGDATQNPFDFWTNNFYPRPHMEGDKQYQLSVAG